MKKSEEKEFNLNEYYTPMTNGVVVEIVKNYKVGDVTASGIIIGDKLPSTTPEADEEDLMSEDRFKVVAVGPDCTRVKVGDLVMLLPASKYFKLPMFAGEYLHVFDYNIMAILSEGAIEVHQHRKRELAKRKESVRAASIAKLLGVQDDKSIN